VIISPAIVGLTAGPSEQEVDARWLMAYAAGIGETAPEYLDTLRPLGIAAHPLFSVCYEWPLMVDLRARAFSEEVARRSVHAAHDLSLHRPVRPGDRLRTMATVVAVEARPSGTYVRVRLDTVDAAGEPVSTTEYGSLHLGVRCDGQPRADAAHEGGVREMGPRAADRSPRRANGGPATAGGDAAGSWTVERPVSATLAHVYSECARIWNPIHTDRAIARQAGLPDIILHGTATLALAVSAALEHEEPGAAARVRRIACRFGGMVRMPSVLTVRGRSWTEAPGMRWIELEAISAEGRPAVRGGRVLLADDRAAGPISAPG
jgi:acyl dehydratase